MPQEMSSGCVYVGRLQAHNMRSAICLYGALSWASYKVEFMPSVFKGCVLASATWSPMDIIWTQRPNLVTNEILFARITMSPFFKAVD